MRQEDYREAIARTWNDEPPADYQPANAALGIVGEVGEYAGKPTADELGDLLYYVTTLRRLLELPVYAFPDTPGTSDEAERPIEALRRLAGQVAELTKKFVFHGERDEAMRRRIDRKTGALLQRVAAEAGGRVDAELERVRAENVEKLLGRYPDGFEPRVDR
jgi:NTP pyrophosphatase (non-canonical NTP hydrolase)